jgi:dienelactone hydrolase
MTPISFDNGSETLSAFEAAPTRSEEARTSAVLLLPAIAGVNEYMRGAAQRLAENGHRVVLLDYYCREGRAPEISTPEKIGQAVAALNDERVLSDARAACEYLRERPDVDPNRIATFGFCIGGVYAFLAACEANAIAAAVNYYGSIRYGAITANKPVSPIDRVPFLRAPLLAHFGNYDRLISGEDIVEFENALQRCAKPYELFIYRGAPHAFDEHHRAAVYRPVASKSAWQRSLTFLNWHLRGLADHVRSHH